MAASTAPTGDRATQHSVRLLYVAQGDSNSLSRIQHLLNGEVLGITLGSIALSLRKVKVSLSVAIVVFVHHYDALLRDLQEHDSSMQIDDTFSRIVFRGKNELVADYFTRLYTSCLEEKYTTGEQPLNDNIQNLMTANLFSSELRKHGFECIWACNDSLHYVRKSEVSSASMPLEEVLKLADSRADAMGASSDSEGIGGMSADARESSPIPVLKLEEEPKARKQGGQRGSSLKNLERSHDDPSSKPFTERDLSCRVTTETPHHGLENSDMLHSHIFRSAATTECMKSYLEFVVLPRLAAIAKLCGCKVEVKFSAATAEFVVACVSPLKVSIFKELLSSLSKIIKEKTYGYEEQVINFSSHSLDRTSDMVHAILHAIDNGVAGYLEPGAKQFIIGGCPGKELNDAVKTIKAILLATSEERETRPAEKQKRTRKLISSSSNPTRVELMDTDDTTTSLYPNDSGPLSLGSGLTSRSRGELMDTGDAAISLYPNDSGPSSFSADLPSRSMPIMPEVHWVTGLRDEVKFVTKSAALYICIGSADITKLKIDAIVNAANGDLMNGAGVAGAISKAAGYDLDKACREYIWEYGSLQDSENCTTTAGYLPCKQVIHAVGPRWYEHTDKSRCADLLKQTFLNCFKKAEEMKFVNIAVPAISAAIFGVPKHVVAEEALGAVLRFEGNHPRHLQVICLVDIDREMVGLFKSQFTKAMTKNYLNSYSENPSTRSFVKHSSSGRSDVSRELRINTKRNSFHGKDTESSCASAFKSSLTPEISEGTEAVKYFSSSGGGTSGKDCPICMDRVVDGKTLDCSHTFCSECLKQALANKNVCPICSKPQGALVGNQPNGEMSWSFLPSDVSGYDRCGTIVIEYHFPSGKQQSNQPEPGRSYKGTRRKAYLPCNPEGRQVLWLLKKAFSQKVLFTIGHSVTTNHDNVVIWNDIHHKTAVSGGPTNYGYPDPTYFDRVKEELASKGIKRDDWGPESKIPTPQPEDCWTCDAPLGQGSMNLACRHMVCGLCAKQYFVRSYDTCYRCKMPERRLYNPGTSYTPPTPSLDARSGPGRAVPRVPPEGSSVDPKPASGHRIKPSSPVGDKSFDSYSSMSHDAGSRASASHGTSHMVQPKWLSEGNVKTIVEYLAPSDAKVLKVVVDFSEGIQKRYKHFSSYLLYGYLPDSRDGRSIVRLLRTASEENKLCRLSGNVIEFNYFPFTRDKRGRYGFKTEDERYNLTGIQNRLQELGIK